MNEADPEIFTQTMCLLQLMDVKTGLESQLSTLQVTLESEKSHLVDQLALQHHQVIVCP